MVNRLKSATSPYLLQHADNPVGLVAVVRRTPLTRQGAATCPSSFLSATRPVTGAMSWHTSRSRTRRLPR